MNGPLTLLLSRLYCLTALIALRLALHFREITGAVNEKCISLCFAVGFNTNGQQAKEMKCVIFWFGSVRKVKCMNSAPHKHSSWTNQSCLHNDGTGKRFVLDPGQGSHDS